jgi:hypothetical protein
VQLAVLVVGGWGKFLRDQPRIHLQAILELQQLEPVVAVEAIDPEEVLGVLVFQQVQPLQIVEAMVERAALFLQHQQQPLLGAAVLALLKLTVTTALTQPLILLVAMAVVVEAPV